MAEYAIAVAQCDNGGGLVMKMKVLGVVTALALCGMASNASTITVGTTDAGNCSLGGCLFGSFVEYEQIYSALAFTGPVTFNRIGFFERGTSTADPKRRF
jgi:hypothetical protein